MVAMVTRLIRSRLYIYIGIYRYFCSHPIKRSKVHFSHRYTVLTLIGLNL